MKKCIFLFFLLLFFSCVKTYEFSFKLEYEPKNATLSIYDENRQVKDCKVYRFVFFKNGVAVKEKLTRKPEITFEESVLDGIDSLGVFCEEKKIKEFALTRNFFKTNRALYYGVLNLKEVALSEREYFSYDVFFNEFKVTALSNRDTFLKSLEVIEMLPIDKRFEFVMEGYKRFGEVKALEYLIENYNDFLSLIEYEGFLKELLEKGQADYQKRIIEKTFNMPSKRVFLMLIPYLSNNINLANYFISNLSRQDKNHPFIEFTFNFFINENNEDNKLYEAYVNYGIQRLEGGKRSAFVKKMLLTKKYVNLVAPVIRSEGIDFDTAQFVLNNFSNVDKTLKMVLYPHLLSYFKDNEVFYKLYLVEMPEMEEQLLTDVVREGIRGEFFFERLLKGARKRPVPFYVINFLEKGDIKEKTIFEIVFTEPVTQKEVLELMEKYDKTLFKDKIFKILKDEKNELWDYAMGKVEGLEKGLDFLFDLYPRLKVFDKKVKVLAALAKMGVRGESFVLKKLENKEVYDLEVIKNLIIYGNDEHAKKTWNLVNIQDKNLYVSALNALADRRKPLICGELLNVMLNEKDRDIKFASFWAYVYSCEDGFLNNFELIIKDADDDFYIEAMSGFVDFISLYPNHKERAITKVKEILSKERRKEVIEILKGLVN